MVAAGRVTTEATEVEVVATTEDDSDEYDDFDDEPTVVNGVPTCPRCQGALGDISKPQDEFRTLKCLRLTCAYGRVGVRPKTE